MIFPIDNSGDWCVGIKFSIIRTKRSDEGFQYLLSNGPLGDRGTLNILVQDDDKDDRFLGVYFFDHSKKSLARFGADLPNAISTFSVVFQKRNSSFELFLVPDGAKKATPLVIPAKDKSTGFPKEFLLGKPFTGKKNCDFGGTILATVFRESESMAPDDVLVFSRPRDNTFSSWVIDSSDSAKVSVSIANSFSSICTEQHDAHFADSFATLFANISSSDAGDQHLAGIDLTGLQSIILVEAGDTSQNTFDALVEASMAFYEPLDAVGCHVAVDIMPSAKMMEDVDQIATHMSTTTLFDLVIEDVSDTMSIFKNTYTEFSTMSTEKADVASLHLGVPHVAVMEPIPTSRMFGNRATQRIFGARIVPRKFWVKAVD